MFSITNLEAFYGRGYGGGGVYEFESGRMGVCLGCGEERGGAVHEDGGVKRFFAWLTGGRPMTKECFAFRDIVAHRPVYIWKDFYGRFWMATTRWGWFRKTNRFISQFF